VASALVGRYGPDENHTIVLCAADSAHVDVAVIVPSQGGGTTRGNGQDERQERG